MRILLDTNAFVRWLVGQPLPRQVARALLRPDTERLVSIVTAWEITMKPTLRPGPAEVESGIKKMGGTRLPIRFAHLTELSTLPLFEDHRDPF